MMLSLLVGALVVSGLGAWVSRRWRGLGQALMVLGGLGLIGVLALQVRQNVFPPEPKAPGRCEMAVSGCLADCMMRDLSAQTGDVILLFPNRRFMAAETEQGYEAGFTLPLRHTHRGLHMKALHLEATQGKGGPGLSEFKQALEQCQDALAVVSYAGAPAGLDALLAEQPKHAPLYVFDPDGTTHWLAALKSGQIRAVILPRPGTSSRERSSATGMSQTVFDRFYLLATPQTADQVAAEIRKK
jgi:hypothetical protein